jgi:eukaryotic-like serine/threonine-protein kinase
MSAASARRSTGPEVARTPTAVKGHQCYRDAVNPAERAGTVIAGRYHLIKLIGRGAMADVYRARGGADLEVAIKILRHSLLGDAEAVARFEREAHVQGLVRHRNVAALLDSGVTDRGEPFIAVELLRGRSLRTVIKHEGRVSARRAASYTWQALHGLSAVHARGIVHRDVKPANLMLEPSPGPIERVVVIDFGFASLEGGSKLTQQGHVVGSLTYMAPERLRGEPGDERSDVYALGVILIELLAGTAPFEATNDFELVHMHLNDPPPAIRALNPAAADVTPALEAVARRALAKTVAERYGSAAEMAAAVEAAARDLP